MRDIGCAVRGAWCALYLMWCFTELVTRALGVQLSKNEYLPVLRATPEEWLFLYRIYRGLKGPLRGSRTPYPVVAGRMVHPTLRKPCARPVEQDPPYQYPCAWGV